MKFQALSLLLLASVLAPLAQADDEPVLDCSPPAAMGFRAEREHIYLRTDDKLAVYSHSRAGTPSEDYSVALAAGTEKITKDGGESVDTPDGIYVGVGKNGAAMQISFRMSDITILLQRDPDAYGTVLSCVPNKRVSIDWEKVKAAAARAPDSTLF